MKKIHTKSCASGVTFMFWGNAFLMQELTVDFGRFKSSADLGRPGSIFEIWTPSDFFQLWKLPLFSNTCVFFFVTIARLLSKMRGGPVVNAPKKTQEEKREQERALKIQVEVLESITPNSIECTEKDIDFGSLHFPLSLVDWKWKLCENIVYCARKHERFWRDCEKEIWYSLLLRKPFLLLRRDGIFRKFRE